MNHADHEQLFRSWSPRLSRDRAKVASSFTLSASDRDDLIQKILLRVLGRDADLPGGGQTRHVDLSDALNRGDVAGR